MGRGGLTTGGQVGHSPTRTFGAFSARCPWMASAGVDMATAAPGSPTHTQQQGRSETTSPRGLCEGQEDRAARLADLVSAHPRASRREPSGLTGTMATTIIETKCTQERGIPRPPPASEVSRTCLVTLRLSREIAPKSPRLALLCGWEGGVAFRFRRNSCALGLCRFMCWGPPPQTNKTHTQCTKCFYKDVLSLIVYVT